MHAHMRAHLHAHRHNTHARAHTRARAHMPRHACTRTVHAVLQVTFASFLLTAMSVIAGLFGMNLANRLETSYREAAQYAGWWPW